jgi:hypothetical protein
MRLDAEVYTRLGGIQELWRELCLMFRSSPTYETLIEQIRAESLAYQARINVCREPSAKP